MKKTLLGLALLGMAATAFAVPPGPTCGTDAPFDVNAVVNGPNVDLTWGFDVGNTCDPTKYAIEVYAQYGPFLGEGCDGTSTTLSLTSEKGDPAPTSASFPLTALTPPFGYCFCDFTQVKVKALTTAPGGSNKSQNNAFSDTFDLELVGCNVPI